MRAVSSVKLSVSGLSPAFLPEPVLPCSASYLVGVRVLHQHMILQVVLPKIFLGARFADKGSVCLLQSSHRWVRLHVCLTEWQQL